MKSQHDLLDCTKEILYNRRICEVIEKLILGGIKMNSKKRQRISAIIIALVVIAMVVTSVVPALLM